MRMATVISKVYARSDGLRSVAQARMTAPLVCPALGAARRIASSTQAASRQVCSSPDCARMPGLYPAQDDAPAATREADGVGERALECLVSLEERFPLGNRRR